MKNCSIRTVRSVVEVVQLFERFRIVGSSDVQMLGDLFEQLLNKGFKQNEGQFFTPIPITRFIWDSLPLTDVIKKDRGVEYPKIAEVDKIEAEISSLEKKLADINEKKQEVLRKYL